VVRSDTLVNSESPQCVSEVWEINEADIQLTNALYPLAQEAIRRGYYMPNRGSVCCSRHQCPHWRRCEQLLVSAAVLRRASVNIRLDSFPGRFPSPLAHRRGQYLRRFRARGCLRQCSSPVRQPTLAASHGSARWCGQIGLPFRCSGLVGEVHACRSALVTSSSTAGCWPGPFLAVRRLGCSGRTIGCSGGVSVALEPRLLARGSFSGSTRCLFHRSMDAGR
jgi:hypothetical protein